MHRCVARLSILPRARRTVHAPRPRSAHCLSSLLSLPLHAPDVLVMPLRNCRVHSRPAGAFSLAAFAVQVRVARHPHRRFRCPSPGSQQLQLRHRLRIVMPQPLALRSFASRAPSPRRSPLPLLLVPHSLKAALPPSLPTSQLLLVLQLLSSFPLPLNSLAPSPVPVLDRPRRIQQVVERIREL